MKKLITFILITLFVGVLVGLTTLGRVNANGDNGDDECKEALTFCREEGIPVCDEALALCEEDPKWCEDENIEEICREVYSFCEEVEDECSIKPTPTPTISPTPTPTPTASPSATPTPTPSESPSPTPEPECEVDCEEPTPSPTPTPEPTVTPSSTPVVVHEPSTEVGAPVCTSLQPVLLPANPLVWRNGSMAIVQWVPTEGNLAHVYYFENQNPDNAHAVRDTENDGYVEIEELGSLDWTFGIQQANDCAGGETVWIVDGDTEGWVLFR